MNSRHDTDTALHRFWVAFCAYSVFPAKSYLTNVGDGASRSEAEIKALQGIASVFGQSVQSTNTASQRMAQAKADGKVATAQTNVFSQDIQRKVNVDNLIGVEIKEFWQDEKNATWYAVAVLDRANAADIYFGMIQKNSETISRIFSNKSIEDGTFERYAAYDFAEDIAVENEKQPVRRFGRIFKVRALPMQPILIILSYYGRQKVCDNSRNCSSIILYSADFCFFSMEIGSPAAFGQRTP